MRLALVLVILLAASSAPAPPQTSPQEYAVRVQEPAGIITNVTAIVGGEPGLYTTTLYVLTDVPARCSFSGPNAEFFVRATSDGVTGHTFVAKTSEKRYETPLVACAKSCGDGVCQDRTIGGAERAGKPSPNNFYTCPQDCGCGGGLEYGLVFLTPGCAPACTQETKQLGGETFVTKGCATSRAGGFAILNNETCELRPAHETWCVRCEEGLYFDSKGECTRVHYRDGVCRSDFGEPMDSPDCENIKRESN